MARVWDVWNEIVQRGIRPSVTICNALVDACARNRQMDHVPQILEDMRKMELTPNLITFSTILKGFCQRGDVPAAIRVLEGMRKETDLQPDGIMYNTLLDGCAQCGLNEEGEALFDEMQTANIPVTNYTLWLAIRLAGGARKLDRAFELMESCVRKYRLKPTSQVYDGLIQACITNRKIPRAIGAFEQMKRERIQPEARTIQVLIRGCLNGGYFQEADSMLRLYLGLQGGDGAEKRLGGNADSKFVSDMLRSFMDRGKQAPQATKLFHTLLADIRNLRPRGVHLDAALEGMTWK
jgi:pentatricopeptide repeat protein